MGFFIFEEAIKFPELKKVKNKLKKKKL